MEFKRGTIIKADYKGTTFNYGHGIIAHLLIESEDKVYEVDWAMSENNQLLGVGDKVSFLLRSPGFIQFLRLNPF